MCRQRNVGIGNCYCFAADLYCEDAVVVQFKSLRRCVNHKFKHMLIPAEQMSVFQKRKEDDFARRLSAHLREKYETTVVRLSEKETTVSELSDEELNALVHVCIKRAQKFGISYESAIAAFTAIMFDAAPNFPEHEIARLHLKDENVKPNSRVDNLLEQLTVEDWKTIKRAYDVNAWKPNGEDVKG